MATFTIANFVDFTRCSVVDSVFVLDSSLDGLQAYHY